MQPNTMRDLVRRLLTQEAVGGQDSASLAEAAERAVDKLRTHLSKRIGQQGFQTLLSRALTLATAQFPYLSAVHVEADGSLIGLREAVNVGSQGGEGSQEKQDGEVAGQETQRDGVDGAVALLAHVFTLLVIFIGEALTRRILSAVWPELALDDAAGWENPTP